MNNSVDKNLVVYKVRHEHDPKEKLRNLHSNTVVHCHDLLDNYDWQIRQNSQFINSESPQRPPWQVHRTQKKTSAACKDSEAASELDNNINVQFKQDQLHFLARVGIQRYQDTHKVERPKMISITNEKTLEEESVRVESQMIRNDTDEKAVRKESVESKRQGIRSPTDEKTLRKDSVESKVLRNATDEKALRKESV